MSTASEQNGAQSTPAEDELQEQIEQDRRDLTETISALHDKTDVKGRVREKAAEAEIAAADLAGRVGRKAGSVPRIAKQATDAASKQVQETVNKVPEPVRTPVQKAAGLVRRELRVVVAVLTAFVTIVAVRQRRHKS